MLRHCSFSAFVFDTGRKAFGIVQREGGAVERRRLLLEELALSLQSTQGLVLWAALKAQWALHCEAGFQGVQPSLDDFVACWMCILEVWRARGGRRDRTLYAASPPSPPSPPPSSLEIG